MSIEIAGLVADFHPVL